MMYGNIDYHMPRHRLLAAAAALLTVVGLCLFASPTLASQDDEESSDPTYEVEPYGFARLDSVLLTHRMNHPQFSMWVRPDDVSSGGTPNLTVYGRLTRLGVRFSADGLGEDVDVEGKIEMDFQNGGSESRPLPRLRHGYGRVEVKRFFVQAGQTWDLFSPLYPSAHADALMWNAGNIGDRRPQLRIGLAPDDSDFRLNAVAAAATTGAVDSQDLDGNGRLDGFDSGVPMTQGLLELQWVNWTDSPLKFGVSGHYAVESPAEFPADPDGDGPSYGGEDSFRSWSVNAHLHAPLTDWLDLRGELFHGQDLEDVRGSIAQSIHPTTGEEISSTGGWIEASLNPVDPYNIALGATIDDVQDGDLEPSREDLALRTLNRTLYTVHTVRPWERIRFGLEYWLWETQFQSRPTGLAHRFNFHTTFYF